ncbi:hypothetical protein DZA65_04271 [Dickeya dianthicola]|nr:Uncharacterized protein YidR [Dickeya dianthicola RNS04.9]AYC21103.1 hypothetical protein DZA65_04271 [Dickeya dianthicola]
MKNEDRQIALNAFSHQLTNINIWSCDGNWLIYDVRPHRSSFTGLTIARVNVETRQREVIYRAGQGAHVGVATGRLMRQTARSETPPVGDAVVFSPHGVASPICGRLTAATRFLW